MLCKKCGLKNAPLAEVCRGCGAVLTPNTATAGWSAGTPETQSRTVSAIGWYLTVLKKYAVFDGRAARKEFWYFFLFNILISIALAILNGIVGTSNGQYLLVVLCAMYAVATLVPALAVGVRRLHDVNLSGWLLLLVLVPLVGSIVLLVLYAQDSKPGNNRYGSSPKAGLDPSMLNSAPAANPIARGVSRVVAGPVQPPQTSSPPAPDRVDSHEGILPAVQAGKLAAGGAVFCTKCGARNPADARFCYSCGGLLFIPDEVSAKVEGSAEPTDPLTDCLRTLDGGSAASGDMAPVIESAQDSPSGTDQAALIIVVIGLILIVVVFLIITYPRIVRNGVPPTPPDAVQGNLFDQALKEVGGTSAQMKRKPEAYGRNDGRNKRPANSATEAVKVHTLVDASACTAFVQSDKPQEQISDLSGLKIEKLSVYKADGWDTGWDVGYDLVNRTAVRGSQNSFAGFCVSEVTVDFELHDPVEFGETWHERDDESLNATETVNSASHNVKEYTSEPPVVVKATIVSALGMPVETARNLNAAHPSSEADGGK